MYYEPGITSHGLPHGVDEFERAGLVKLPSRKVKPARVGARRSSLSAWS
jgi:hypothetical protein